MSLEVRLSEAEEITVIISEDKMTIHLEEAGYRSVTEFLVKKEVKPVIGMVEPVTIYKFKR